METITDVEEGRQTTISVSEFVDQCAGMGMSNFAQYLGENYMYSGGNPPSEESLVSYLFKEDYKRLGENLISQYIENPNRAMTLPLATLMKVMLEPFANSSGYQQKTMNKMSSKDLRDIFFSTIIVRCVPFCPIYVLLN